MSNDRVRRIGELTVTIERERCVAAETCIVIAPELFELDAEGFVTFRPGAPGTIDPERLLAACASCPTGALIVRDASGRRLVP